MELIFVTGNAKKYSEVKRMILPEIKLIQEDVDVNEIQTRSLHKISADKAMKAFEKLKKPLIVEDTGCYMGNYDQFPGALSKFIYEGIGQKGYHKLLDKHPAKGRFVCVFSYMDASLETPLQLVWEAEGVFNFGDEYNENADSVMKYNHVFYPGDSKFPVCEMYDEWQEKLSHRVDGVKKLNRYLKLHIHS